jgi:hypothetical protein
MKRHEVFRDGQSISAVILDSDMIAFEEHGVVVDGPRPMTVEERRRYGKPPLDQIGAAMTLLAVNGVVSVEDAANAVGLTPDDLVAEAEAWAVAGS